MEMFSTLFDVVTEIVVSLHWLILPLVGVFLSGFITSNMLNPKGGKVLGFLGGAFCSYYFFENRPLLGPFFDIHDYAKEQPHVVFFTISMALIVVVTLHSLLFRR